MGEIAEMMMDGTLCAGCGAYLEDSIEGIPNYCSKDCEPDGYGKNTKTEKIKCDLCNKMCGGEQGLKAHKLAIHKED